MALRRHILAPWAFSSLAMFVLSYLWHGLFLQDLAELEMALSFYLGLAGVAYLIIGLLLTVAAHKAIQMGYVSLKGAFPIQLTLMGAVVGGLVFVLLFALGMSFTKNDVVHVLADLVWQMVEQAVGGLAVSLGIIYDLHQSFLEEERAG